MHALGDRVVAALRERVTVLPFHAEWIRRTFAPGVEISALSVPRGSAKTWIAGQLGALALTPGSPLWRPGIETLAVSASLEQSRVLLSFVRDALADEYDRYRWLDSGQRLAVTHKATGTKLRVLSSNAKRAMGLSQFGLIMADEPGAWEVRGGELMYHALRQSLGKLPEQRLVLIGTRAPADDGTWWPALLDAGSGPGTHITALSAPDGEPWDAFATVRAVNPLLNVNASLRRTVLRERDEARRNPTLRRAYEAYRLNRQVGVHEDILVEVETWRRVERRKVPPRLGRPIVGIDLGASRSWSAAWCLWPNGRGECYALCPGVPDLDQRERDDAVPAGLYRRLYADGVLLVDEGRRMSRPEVLIDRLTAIGIRPAAMYADRFLEGALADVVRGRWPVVFRQTRWSQATTDIAAFRRLAGDGPLSVAPECRALARVAMGAASVLSDEQGSARIRKRKHGRSRDDVAIAAVLAAGAHVRAGNRPARRWRSGGLAG